MNELSNNNKTQPARCVDDWIGVHVEGGGYRELIHLLRSKLVGSLYAIPLLSIQPPCKKYPPFIFNTFQDIPTKSIKSPCGKPNCWIIKYDIE